eukprot:gene6788-8423_t
MLLISGLVFGWSPLEEELEKQDAFGYLCPDGTRPCNSQALRLNLVYTIGAFTATGSAFLSGWLFDTYGPIWTNLLAGILMVLGCIFWHISYLYFNNLYILAFALIGIGGPACQVSLLHVNNLFPSISESISSTFSGMFVAYIGVIIILFLPTLFLLDHTPYLPIDDVIQQEQEQAIEEKLLSSPVSNGHSHHHQHQHHIISNNMNENVIVFEGGSGTYLFPDSLEPSSGSLIDSSTSSLKPYLGNLF